MLSVVLCTLLALLRVTLVGFREHEICAAVELGVQVRLIVSANPFVAVTLMAEDPDTPGVTVLDWPSIRKSGEGAAASQAVSN
jgi:hypothetical protein